MPSEVGDDPSRSLSVGYVGEVLGRSLTIGTFAGATGSFVGAGFGIARSAPPLLFAIFTGLQWFALGSTFTAAEGLVRPALGGVRSMTTRDHAVAGGIAGGVAGAAGGALRGQKNIAPGMLVLSLIGAGTSPLRLAFEKGGSDERAAQPKEANTSWTTSWMDSKWSPIQRLSDEEYEKRLEDQLLRLDAEIAIIDEHIATLKASKTSNN